MEQFWKVHRYQLPELLQGTFWATLWTESQSSDQKFSDFFPHFKSFNMIFVHWYNYFLWDDFESLFEQAPPHPFTKSQCISPKITSPMQRKLNFPSWNADNCSTFWIALLKTPKISVQISAAALPLIVSLRISFLCRFLQVWVVRGRNLKFSFEFTALPHKSLPR